MPNRVYLILLLFSYSLFAQNYDQRKGISVDSLQKHTEFLGGDALAGRGTGSKGEKLAVAYITDQFEAYGLLPAGDRKTYFQNIPMHGSFPLATSRLTVYNRSGIYQLTLGQDYLLYKTGAATYIPTPAPLVFVGYGIIAPEFDYNDYLNIDVEEKVVVFLVGEPYSEDTLFFDGANATVYSSVEAKQRLALSLGARGSLMISLPTSDPDMEWQYWVNEFAFEHVSLAYTVTSHMSALIYPEIARILFEKAPFSLSDVIEMHKTGRLISFDLQSEISFKGKFKERDFVAQNVIGKREGHDKTLSTSYVILAAHFDHLGLGPVIEGDSIYNGVLDNGLGVAALLEIVRLIGTDNKGPRRSVLFIAFTGEEKGLLGSSYYIDHPAVPLYRTIANINIDGVSAFDKTKDFIGVGTEYSTLNEDLLKICERLGLGVSKMPEDYFYEAENINRSDQYAFMKAGVPSILVVEGVNYLNTPYQEGLMRLINWNQTIYHTPFDDLNQKINYESCNSAYNSHLLSDTGSG